MLTLSTYALIVHRGTDKALRAGNVYLGYTLAGGAVLLIGVIRLYNLLGNVEFTHGGVLSQLPSEQYGELITIFALLLLPPLVTAVATLAAGIFANTEVSPLAWAQLIAGREYVGAMP